MKHEIKLTNKSGEVNYECDGIIGKVPGEIVERGEKDIKEFVRSQIISAYTKIRKRRLAEEEIRENPIPVKTEYFDGTLLEGRIVEANPGGVFVELDNPLKGSGCVMYGVASARGGDFVFENNELSDSAYESAYRGLRTAYEEALSKSQQDLIIRENEEYWISQGEKNEI